MAWSGQFIGLNKGPHHASVCWISAKNGSWQTEIFQKERFTRIKYDGGSLLGILKKLEGRYNPKRALICENALLDKPIVHETHLELDFPYFDWLKKRGLGDFSSRFNPEIRFAPHHYCHAMAAVEMSPFRKSLIVVADGAGNYPEVFPEKDPESKFRPRSKLMQDDGISFRSESITAYAQSGSSLRCLEKNWQTYVQDDPNVRILSDGLGIFYQNAAKYIFNSRQESGKVMGLAPYGSAKKIDDRLKYFREKLDWNQAFKGHGKKSWENSGGFQRFADIAASAQTHYENSLLSFLQRLKKKYPSYDRLILTGGCALNCVANQKVLESHLFDEVYIPPFPGDESISLGAAAHLKYRIAKIPWEPRGPSEQTACFGPIDSSPTEREIRFIFRDHALVQSPCIEKHVARILSEGAIVGWFQGRSESGPRALGNRSLLANPLIQGTRDLLNEKIKKRESFRPYAGSCTRETISRYFEVGTDFESPFMSFAPKIRKDFRSLFSEIRHIDDTCRVQSVQKEQNPRFHALIEEFGRITGTPCVLNTSMNVMGEPIVETVEDAKRFLDGTRVDGLAIGDFFIPALKRGIRAKKSHKPSPRR